MKNRFGKKMFSVLISICLIVVMITLTGFIQRGNYNKAYAIANDVTISNITVIPTPNTPNSLAQYVITFNISGPMDSGDKFVIQNFIVGIPTPQASNFLGHVSVNNSAATTQVIGPTSASGGASLILIITLTQSLPAGTVTIFIDTGAGIHNPSSGTYQLSIYPNDSSGSVAQSAAYSIGQGGVSDVNVTASPSLVDTAARYTVSFKTSLSGALTANIDTISLQFPVSTTIPASIAASYVTVQGIGCTTAPSIVQGSNTLTITVPANISAGATVTVVISELAQIKNPPTASNYELTVWTSKDANHKTSNYYSITASSVTKPSVTLSPSTVQSSAQYTISFHISSSGSLSAGSDTIVITFPSGTSIPTSFSASAVKVNNTVCSDVSRGPNVNQITITTPVDVVSSGAVTVVISSSFGIKNPAAAGTYTLKVHTSKDPSDVESDSYSIGSSKVSDVSVTVVPNMQKVQASYIIQFKTGAAGSLSSGDKITVTFPSGTLMPVSIPANYVSVNGAVPSSVIVTSYSRTVDITLPTSFNVIPFQTVVVTIQKDAGIKNPNAGTYTIKVKTNKEPDTVDSAQYSILGLPNVVVSAVPVSPNGSNGYYTVKPKVTLSLSGSSTLSVDIYYNIDNGAFQKYSNPFEIPDGKHTVYYYCQDNLGDKSQVNAKTFMVDTTVPKLTVTSPADGTSVYSNTVAISGVVSNATSLTINGHQVQFTDKTGLFTYSVTLSKEGTNAINIIATDNAGNKAAKTINVIYIKRVTIIMQIGNKYAYVNGMQKLLDYPPFIYKGRTMVPLRFISQTFNAKVYWDPIFKIVTIELNGKRIRVQVGNTTYDNNGKTATLDAAPVIKNGHTFVPLRLIIESFGGEITWDPKMQIINIVYPKP